MQRAGPVDEPRHPDADRRGVGSERPRQLEEHVDQPVAAVGGGHAVLGEDRAPGARGSMATPRIFVPPTSSPTLQQRRAGQ